MKLEEQILHCPDEQGWTNPNVSRTKNIVEIAENFAVGFAEWCFKYDRIHRNHVLTTKELLEIYKGTL